MCVWPFAYHNARIGLIWQQMAIDRCRFQRRIHQSSEVINRILTIEHREKFLTSLQKMNESKNVTQF